MRLSAIGPISGRLFGGLVNGAQLHDYGTMHAMLRLDEPDVFLLIASAPATSTPLLWLLERRGPATPLDLHERRSTGAGHVGDGEHRSMDEPTGDVLVRREA